MASIQNLAPIVLFVYNRPEHTQKTLKALTKNELAEDSIIYIYCDGIDSRTQNSEARKVNSVKKIVKETSAFKQIWITEREKNFGLAKNIVEGITEVLENYDKAIILEDDIVTSPFFLSYMNQALIAYKEIKKVMHIGGFSFEINNLTNLPNTYFLKYMNCWGWGTWSDRWQLYNDDSSLHLRKMKENNSLKEFNLDGVIKFDQQLIDNINEEIDTWAINWYSTIFRNGGLCLYPNKSLVRNIGFDGTGVHYNKKADSKKNKAYVSKLSDDKILIDEIPIEESKKARKYLKKYFQTDSKKVNRLRSLISKVITFLKKNINAYKFVL